MLCAKGRLINRLTVGMTLLALLTTVGCVKRTQIPSTEWSDETLSMMVGMRVTVRTVDASYLMTIKSVEDGYITGTVKERGERSSDPFKLVDVTVKISDVRSMETSEVEAGKSVLAVIGTIVGIYAIAMIILISCCLFD